MATERLTTADRIIQDPDILVGKPVIRGTRIPVELILAKLAANPNIEELLADFPRLTMDDIKACLAYAQGLVEQQGRARKEEPRPTPTHGVA